MPGSTLNRLIFWRTGQGLPDVAGDPDRAARDRAGLIQQAAQMGLSLTQVIEAIPLFVPNTLPYTIPATTLFASCVVYGRLSHDNEVVAIKARRGPSHHHPQAGASARHHHHDRHRRALPHRHPGLAAVALRTVAR